MMQTLFNDSETFQKERPIKPTELQMINFYEAKANELKKEGFSTDENEDIIKDLKSIFPFRDNGYELAKELDGYGMSATYDVDVSFCEWLETLHIEYYQIEKENIKAWVKAHNPIPKFEKGDKLLIIRKLNNKMDKSLEVFVNGSSPEEATYWLNDNTTEYGGIVVPYETVENNCVLIN